MKKLFAMAFVFALGGAIAAQAHAAFSFNGNDGAPTAGEVIQFKLQNFEVVLDHLTAPAFNPAVPPTAAQVLLSAQPGGLLDDVGDQVYGIFKITSIESADGTKQHWVASPNQQLAGVFWGYTARTVPTTAVGGNVEFELGALKLFFDDTPDFTAATGPFKPLWLGADLSNGVGNAGDTPFFDAVGVGGVLPQPPATNVPVTLDSTFTAFNTTHFTGVGDGFLTITATSTLVFAPDGMDSSTSGAYPYPGNQTLSLKSNFDSRPAGTPTGDPLDPRTDYEEFTGWSVGSQDPIVGVFEGVTPEPSTGIMFAFGSLLAGAVGLWKKRSASRTA